MCTIIGWAGKVGPELLRQLYAKTVDNGPHSVGLACRDSQDGLFTFKKAISPVHFHRKFNREFMVGAESQLGFGHGRYATHGVVTDRNAHPFTHDEITYCHNGIIRNYARLSPEVEVDSECLGPLIKQRRLYAATGSIGLAWFEPYRGNQELFIYRRNQRLRAYTFSFSQDESDRLTIFASYRQVIPEALFQIPYVEYSLEEGVAYMVRQKELYRVWEDPVLTFQEDRYEATEELFDDEEIEQIEQQTPGS